MVTNWIIFVILKQKYVQMIVHFTEQYQKARSFSHPKQKLPLRTSEFVLEHWNLLRKAFPNFERGRNCFFGSTTRAFPGTTPSFSACITAMNLEK
jgi:hypothetical protein